MNTRHTGRAATESERHPSPGRPGRPFRPRGHSALKLCNWQTACCTARCCRSPEPRSFRAAADRIRPARSYAHPEKQGNRPPAAGSERYCSRFPQTWPRHLSCCQACSGSPSASLSRLRARPEAVFACGRETHNIPDPVRRSCSACAVNRGRMRG